MQVQGNHWGLALGNALSLSAPQIMPIHTLAHSYSCLSDGKMVITRPLSHHLAKINTFSA